MSPQPRTEDDLRKRRNLLRSHEWSLLFAFLSFLSFCSPGSLLASEDAAVLPLLTTCQSVHHLALAEANRHFPVRLRAVVSFYERGNEKYGPSLFITDHSGSVFVALTAAPDVALVAGEVVEVTGVSSIGDYAPVVAQGETHVTGRSGLPRTAPRVGIEALMSGVLEGQWVEVKGVVQSVHASEGEITLDLATPGGGMVLTRTPDIHGFDYSQLVDATVVLHGNAAPSFNHQGQITGGKVLFPGRAALKVEEPAPAAPFNLPVQHPGALMRYTPNKEVWHRAHLRGAVTLYWPARLLCVEDDGEGLCAQIKQSTPIRLGDSVDVVGFPATGEFTPILVHATYKPAEGSLSIPAPEITSLQAFGGRYDERLVSVEAKVIGKDIVASDPTFVLSSGASLFTAAMPKALAGKIQDTLEVGSRIRLIGICSVQADSTANSGGSGFLVAKSFRMLLRSPADVEVLETPSWWNAAHTLCVLALALTLALFALYRVVLLARRVARQTEVIRAQLLQTSALKEVAESASSAAEFHAAHDELTGTLNRRMILAALKEKFDSTIDLGSSIGVIMIDLDHFKHVNDTYGHLAGDEVLRETVRRIDLAVRSSDLVGRYGGEEFVVVLPSCNRSQLQACGERIRDAIAFKPMLFGNIAIPMTTSVGSVIAMSPPHPMLDALAAADSALYRAKHGGRNRVVLKDLATGQFEEV